MHPARQQASARAVTELRGNLAALIRCDGGKTPATHAPNRSGDPQRLAETNDLVPQMSSYTAQGGGVADALRQA